MGMVWNALCGHVPARCGFNNSNCYACSNVRICRFSKLDADVKSRFMQAFLSILFATMGGLSFRRYLRSRLITWRRMSRHAFSTQTAS